MPSKTYIDPKGVLPRLASPLVWDTSTSYSDSPLWPPAAATASFSVFFGGLAVWNFTEYGLVNASTIFNVVVALILLTPLLAYLTITKQQRIGSMPWGRDRSRWHPLIEMDTLIRLIDQNASLAKDRKVRARAREVRRYAKTVEWELARRWPVMSRLSSSSHEDLQRIWKRETEKANHMVDQVRQATAALDVYVLRSAADWGTAPAHLEIYGREVDALVAHQDALTELDALEFTKGEKENAPEITRQDPDRRGSTRLRYYR